MIRWLSKLLSGYFSILLILLILLFIFRPYDKGMVYVSIWYIFFIGVLLAALFDVHHSKKVRRLGLALAIPAMIFVSISVFYPPHWIVIIGHGFTLLVMVLCTVSVLYKVLLGARVTLDTLRGVICVYFMIGFMFALGYLIIIEMSPESFHFATKTPPINAHHSYYLSEMFYFSFVTLLAIGYGDILAVTNLGQTCAILEGIIGQFYLAILVAKLVAVYSLFGNSLKQVSFKKRSLK